MVTYEKSSSVFIITPSLDSTFFSRIISDLHVHWIIAIKYFAYYLNEALDSSVFEMSV